MLKEREKKKKKKPQKNNKTLNGGLKSHLMMAR